MHISRCGIPCRATNFGYAMYHSAVEARSMLSSHYREQRARTSHGGATDYVPALDVSRTERLAMPNNKVVSENIWSREPT